MRSAFTLGSTLLLSAICVSPVLGQAAAPYILPYTMSTFAGPHATYTIGQACGNGIGIALDTAGDGCLASSVSVGVDPHDIRVDGFGNVYWIDDNASTALIHKISPVTGLQTVYVGSTVNTSGPCPTNVTPQGDGCPANDGAANVVKKLYTDKTPKSRGLAIGLNGDLFYADYNGSYDHKVSAATGYLSVVTGTGVAYTSNTNSSQAPSPVGTAQVNSSRGIGVDANGNVYVADTGDGQLRAVYSGVGALPGISNPMAGYTYAITAYNPAATNTKSITSGVPAASAILSAPEDVKVDSNGNIYIADFGNSIIRAIYMGQGSLPNVTAPITGDIYTVAGNPVALPTGATNTTYPSDGSTPTVSALSVNISTRKFAIDSRNNLYIADSSGYVVWFVDHVTGQMRLLAGSFGDFPTAGIPAARGCTAQTDPQGDGCPGPEALLYDVSDMGVDSDNQGNLYITDAEAGVAANARLRKQLSGLNFPSLASGSSLIQTILVHFGPKDSAATANAFTITGSGTANVDYTAGAPSCVLNGDTTTDCTVPITFTPARPGYDTATLTITSKAGGVNSYLLTGTGIASAVAIDPGTVTLANNTVSAPQGIAEDGAGNIYTADTGNNRVLITTPAGVTTTFAGLGGEPGNSGDGGLATLATLNGPRGVAVDTSGSVYITDTGNNTIRKVTVDGKINTIGGGAATVCATAFNTRGDGCPATQATFSAPWGITADNFGVLYVADSGNNLIRAINTHGYVSTLAGGAAAVCATAVDVFGDGCSASATTFNAPAGLAFDATGENILVADSGNSIVRSISVGNAVTVTDSATTSVLFNPVTLIAGTGACGNVTDNNASAPLTQLCNATGVAVGPAQSVFIADTGNSAIRLVSAGKISVIAGILSTAGKGTIGSAASVELTAPSAVATSATGTLQIADAGNNRILTDQRSQVSFNFGRINIGQTSPIQTFIESSAGTAAATLPKPLLTSPPQTEFTLTPPADSTGCTSGAFAVNATCILQGQFTPDTGGDFSATFTEAGSQVAGGDPSITLQGTGAVLQPTTGTVAQTDPSTGNAQFGGSVTLTATITPTSCNQAAPACYPTGTVRFIIDGGNPGSPIDLVPGTSSASASEIVAGLSVGPHTISCNYSGDDFYAASTCATSTITVATASTTALLSDTNNNQPQFSTSVLTASVVSTTSGIPTGTVSFFANGTLLGTTPVNATNGVATFTMQETLGPDGNPTFNNTLLPGTYTLTCTYSGSANFSASNCAGITFTVLASPIGFALTARGCQATSLIPSGSQIPSLAIPCTVPNFISGVPLVAVADGSTSDVTIFVSPSNTASGTFTFACSGLPKASTCTFSPTSLSFTAGTAPASPVSVDMTLWTDLQPGVGNASLRSSSNISLALLFGWPITLLGLAGILRFRRKSDFRGISLVALLFLLTGSSLVFSGCGSGGPGAYQPNLTPAGTYPITVTVTGAGLTHTTIVYWTVTAPGLPGQQ